MLSPIKFYRLINNYFATSFNDPDNYNLGYFPLCENNALYVTRGFKEFKDDRMDLSFCQVVFEIQPKIMEEYP